MTLRTGHIGASTRPSPKFMKNARSNVRYEIDATDTVVAVGGDWDQFAGENDSPAALLSASILQRSFWDFVSGATLEHVYRRVLAQVREGHPLEFSFRCDSPALRRFLTLKLKQTHAGGIEFVTETVCTEPRSFQPLFNAKACRVGAVVVACSWCNRIQTGVNVWQEAEDAVHALGLFEIDPLPPLSHGMCHACYKAVMGKAKPPLPDGVQADTSS
jgi:hypothetical protein